MEVLDGPVSANKILLLDPFKEIVVVFVENLPDAVLASAFTGNQL